MPKVPQKVSGKTPSPKSQQDKFISCTPKRLPEELLVKASETAKEINPANGSPARGLVYRVLAETVTAVTGVEVTAEQAPEIMKPERLALLTQKYWGQGGVKLTVGFMQPLNQDLRDRIISHMNAWGQYANVTFAWSKISPQVRITLRGDGYWSYLGTDILHVPANQPTMCLQDFSMNTPESEYKKVVRHETGHTLGCPHEHMRQEIIALLDVQKTIAWGRSALGWDEQTVREQILTPLSESSMRGTPHADQDSIMCYQLPGSVTKNGQPIRGGGDIDQLDGEFIASLYPKAVPPPPPPPPSEEESFTIKVPGRYVLQK